MIYDLQNELQAENFKLRCNALFQKKCIVELTEKKPQRSLPQNKYLHAALGYFGLHVGETIDHVKREYFKRECNPDLFITRKRDKVTGKMTEDIRSSADLTTEEMTIAIERFRNWAVTIENPCYIPSPEEYRLVMNMEREVMINRIYLYGN